MGEIKMGNINAGKVIKVDHIKTVNDFYKKEQRLAKEYKGIQIGFKHEHAADVLRCLINELEGKAGLDF